MSEGEEDRRTNLHLRRWIEELKAERDMLESALIKLTKVMADRRVPLLLAGTTELVTELSRARFGLFVPAGSDDRTVVAGDSAWSVEPDVRAAPILAAVFDGQSPIKIDDVARWAPSPEAAAPYGVMADGQPLRSYLAAAVRNGQGEVIGGLFVASTETHSFSPRHEELVGGLAAQLGNAIETAELTEERQYTATALQQTLLPPSLPQIPGVDLAARYRPTGRDHLVGGDFYDVFEVEDDCWGLVLGDVSGVGPEAAAVTGVARYTIRAVALNERDPCAVLRMLNEAIHRQSLVERFCTAVYLTFCPEPDGLAVVLASGGHPEALILREGGSVEPVDDAHGMLLGLFPEVDHTASKRQLKAGDALVLYTDGVIEARNPQGEQFGEERLSALLASCVGRTAEAIARRIELAAIDWQGGVAADDMAVVVLRAQP